MVLPSSGASAASRPPVVLDVGTGYVKGGLAGQPEPQFVEPTAVGCAPARGGPAGPLSDLDYAFGHEATADPSYDVSYPMRHGVINDWDAWEKLVGAAIYKRLALFPEDHNFILTEPPLNLPENREAAAEIMFETFDVPGLHIGVQAVLALYASFAAGETPRRGKGRPLTGVVIDSGDGCTHAIPVADGYVVGSSIRSVPLAGRDVTAFVQQLHRDRGEPVPPAQSADVARAVKEAHGYVCADLAAEYGKYDAQPEQYFKQYQGTDHRTRQPFSCSVGYERFLGPEIFFSPEIYSTTPCQPLPSLVDAVIQGCPIDTRRALYGNIVLSGGSTMFPGFGERLQRDLARLVAPRSLGAAQSVDVAVHSHPAQRYAVWHGGFQDVVVTREQYMESGPSVVRKNVVFSEW